MSTDSRVVNHDRVALAVGAHPDDIEFTMAGTLVLLREKGLDIRIATVCSGDMGSAQLRNQEIAGVRFKEATDAAGIIGASYYCLGESDLHVVFDNPTRYKTCELVRRVSPSIVITQSPEDYMFDHQLTADLMWDACFNAPVPNYTTSQPNPAKPIEQMPYLFYSDAIASRDRFGQRVSVEFYVDVTSVIETKAEMLGKHRSQRDWLRALHGIDEYILQMKEWCEARGSEAGVRYAEGFRQHKGHPFPRENVLSTILGDLCLLPIKRNLT